MPQKELIVLLPYIKIGSFSLPTYYTFMFLGYVAMIVFMMLPARRKLSEHGISCAGKTARQMTPADYDRYDLLIGMDRWNLRNMERIAGGDPEGKIRPLLSRDVADPWYTDDFDATWRDCLEGCSRLLKELTIDN